MLKTFFKKYYTDYYTKYYTSKRNDDHNNYTLLNQGFQVIKSDSIALVAFVFVELTLNYIPNIQNEYSG